MIEQIFIQIFKEIDIEIQALKDELLTCGIDVIPSRRAAIIRAERDKALMLGVLKRYRKDLD